MDTVRLAVSNNEELSSLTVAERSVVSEFASNFAYSHIASLARKVGLKDLIELRLEFLHFCFENDLQKELAHALVYETSKTLGQLVEEVRERISDTIEVLEISSKMQDEILTFLKVTEDDLMLGEDMGLKPELKIKYQEGALTGLDVLLTQPMLVVSLDI